MIRETEVETIRKTVTLSHLDHVTVMCVGGPGAFALLDAVCPTALFLRENQMRHTLLLGHDGRVVADAYVCCDDQEFIVLAEGLSPAALRAYLEEHKAARAREANVTLNDLSEDHAVIGVNGPYAWELVAAAFGPEVNGMPYLSFLRFDHILCFRAGTTGEYGYDLVLPQAQAPAFWDQLLKLGEPLGVGEAGLEALDQCALENWHFFMRLVDAPSLDFFLTPLELQLQWRISYDKTFVGSEALQARRHRGVAGRATSFTAATLVEAGQRVLCGDQKLGSVLRATRSSTRGDVVGVALIDPRLAHPGIDRFAVETVAGPVPITTRTPPLINNRSLYIDPNRHSGRTRHVDTFPPVVLS